MTSPLRGTARTLDAVARAIGALALVTVVVAGAVRSADAHALLVRSDPAPGMVVAADGSPRRISLWFSEPVSAATDAVVILDANGKRTGRPTSRVAAGEATRLDVDPVNLGPGAYVVRWRVTSADSHVVRGAQWFVVGFAGAPPATAFRDARAPTVSLVEAGARWLGLAAIVVLAGAPLAALFVLRRPGVPLSSSLAILATAAFVVAQILSAAAQAMAITEAPLSQALDGGTIADVLASGRFARLWWTRLALGVGLGAMLARRAGADLRPPRGARVASVLVALGLLITTALAGHAAGGRGALPMTLSVTVDAIHLGAAALWLGALVQVALWLGRVGRAAAGERTWLLAGVVPRLSNAAAISVGVLAATGVLNTYAQAASLAMLVRTAYGQSLLLKLALLVPLLVVAAVNLIVVRPRLAAGSGAASLTQRFRWLVGTELALALVLLLVVGLLGSVPPPGDRRLPAAVENARTAGPVRVALRIEPNWIGVSRFRVTLSDLQGGGLADVRRVILTFAMEGMNMGRTHVTLAPRAVGVYEAEGFYVGMPGTSLVNVAVAREGGDQSALFKIEVPDVSAIQLIGLRAALGLDRSSLGPNPVVADAASLARGRAVYERECAPCHGAGGTGNGPASTSLLPPPADLTLHARWHPDRQLFWFISHGVAGTSMVGFDDRLGPRERWDVINHLHALAAAPGATVARAAPVAPSPVTPFAPSTTATTVTPTRAPRLDAQSPSSTPDGGAPAPRGEPAVTGRIVFGPDFDNNLWLLRLPDGKPSMLTRLGPLEFSSNPVWSPDARRIAFAYYRLPGGEAIPVPDGTDLHLVDAEGGTSRPLAVHDAPGVTLQFPAWSADGTSVYVAYARQGGASLGIDRVDVPSGNRTRVITDAGFPSLSRDGRRMAYVHFERPPARGQSLRWSAPDGSGPHQVVASGVFDKLFGVRVSPDGRRLLFAAVGQPTTPAPTLGLLPRLLGAARAEANGDLWDLWVVDLDGRNLRPVTALSEDLPVGAWSPDGRGVAFIGGGSATSAEAGLSIVSANGSGRRRLTTQPGHRGVDWTRR